MLSWFKKKQTNEAPAPPGPPHPKEAEEARLLEEAFLRLKKQTTQLKEYLRLLQAEAAREDLTHLISLVTAHIDDVLRVVEHPGRKTEDGESAYVINEILFTQSDSPEAEKTLLPKEEAQNLDLTFQPDALPEVGETAPAGKKKILFVEDNEDLRVFYRLALSPFYEIREAPDGVEGLKIAATENPDLIVSDLMMPRMDGIELCKAIKSDGNTNHIPFIILTAKDAVASRLEGTQSGADVYLAKPTSAELLHATIENIFLQRQKIRDHFSKKHYSEALAMVDSVKEQEFFSRFLAIIDENLTNTDFEVDLVCRELRLSRTGLYQKIKSLTGQSIVEFVRSYRLKKAREIMTHENVSLADVIFRVGIQTPSYFTKAFKKEFGQTPSQFLEDLRKRK
ncbi:response regulator [Paraflavisolibacter sp. H34]|uniref:response regulator n=1 Tax=Huijunlia imazamoxiresistens TaxID=3127457 RepID=UPI0030181BDA